MEREELLKSKEYWLARIQNDLFNEIYDFMEANSFNKTRLAEYLGCTKGYITQLLNGDFDHKISKLVELYLAIGKVPQIVAKPVEEIIEADLKADIHSFVYKFEHEFKIEEEKKKQTASYIHGLYQGSAITLNKIRQSKINYY